MNGIRNINRKGQGTGQQWIIWAIVLIVAAALIIIFVFDVFNIFESTLNLRPSEISIKADACALLVTGAEAKFCNEFTEIRSNKVYINCEYPDILTQLGAHPYGSCDSTLQIQAIGEKCNSLTLNAEESAKIQFVAGVPALAHNCLGEAEALA